MSLKEYVMQRLKTLRHEASLYRSGELEPEGEERDACIREREVAIVELDAVRGF